MINSSRLFFLFLLLILAACKDNSPYKGYSKTKSGLYYKIQSFGDSDKKPKKGDFLKVNISYETIRDSVFMTSHHLNNLGYVVLPFDSPSFEGSFEEGLARMSEGDSTSFIVDAQKLFTHFFKSEVPVFLKNESVVKLEVKLQQIIHQNDYANELKRVDSLIQDRDIEEQRKLKLFIGTDKEAWQKLPNGMYYLPIRQGSGPLAAKGNLIKINYEGSFLNGEIFESTYEQGSPLEFTLGEQDQVIPGIENAISLMNEGSKAKFIIPSQLAFGEQGSSTQIVPPFATVIYEIELLKLN
jgi:FKBP-type peptidyl-prolyl cis-trans isomerase